MGKRPTVLVFGEDDNDRKAIASLISALCPNAMPRCLRTPPVLIKGTRPQTARTNTERIADTVRVFEHKEQVACVFAHEDADAIEPHHLPAAERIEAALTRAGISCQVHAVVPAWETENWWFLFPAEVASLHESWIEPSVSGNPGLIRNGKEALAAAVRPKRLKGHERQRFPPYKESDSPKIAERVAESGRARQAKGNSASYDRFVDSVDACCMTGSTKSRT